MTSNKGLLSQLQEIPHLHPHFLVIQLWVSSMAMCVLQATIVLKGVHSQAHVLQVDYQHISSERRRGNYYQIVMYQQCFVDQMYFNPLSFS